MTLRPLKYRYVRDGAGRPITDVYGHRVVDGPPQEKGVDVLCALAVVREAQSTETDLVILASSDSDRAPALDEVRSMGTAKIETTCWYDRRQGLGFQVHPTNRSRALWNTRLDETVFRACFDPTDYS